MLAGDLFSSKNGKLRNPLFTPNMKEVLDSSLVVGKLLPKRMEVAMVIPCSTRQISYQTISLRNRRNTVQPLSLLAALTRFKKEINRSMATSHIYKE
ncbi:hypothetical protein [Paenibacillus sp. YAF4_2]|uniref:hypothetical protein n=1 Tax=Paenibacillus sp. YAF4_2 TaxID=3233085 RepID=UPI003F94813D